MGTDTLSAADLGRIVTAYCDGLGTFQEEINRLNVYPVPDGDTGTNMRMTVEAVRKELENAEDVPRQIVRASLMGARGNSGVILSQVLRGLSEAVSDAGELTAPSLTDGLRRATDLAYGAVTQPQEGTILTVVRESAEEAEADDSDELTALVHRVLDRARGALERTPEQLDVLKQAGVVDAGGRGFVLLLECLLHTLDGTPLPEPQVPERSPAEALEGAEEPATTGPGHEGGSLEFAFEAQFLLDTDDQEADAYRDWLEGYGDCVLVVGGDGLYNVHVHTNDAGTVIERAIEIGRPRQISVTYLEGQVADLHEEQVLAQMRGEEAPTEPEEPLEPLGICAVAAGDGILTIFKSLGVRGLVPGGQTFNPSAEEILGGIRRAHAEEVIVLPNNKNVVGAARTAAGIAIEDKVAKRVEVIPTASPLQGFTAMFSFDPEAGLDANVETMTDEGLGTKHGEVAHATRDAETPAGRVSQGECLGMWDGEVRVVAESPQDGVVQVVEGMLSEGDSLVTLVYGGEIDEWSAHELGKRVSEQFGVEVEVHRGGQPAYPFLIGVE